MPVCMMVLFFVNPNKDHGALYYPSYKNESRHDLNILTDLLVKLRERVPVVNYPLAKYMFPEF